jgi:asparagine synthase (glutamine-hydrolysing)
MCGIFGIVAKDGSFSQDLLERAVKGLAHRGPDDSGVAIIERNPDSSCRVGFAHTRLSILDLSQLGHQPMQDAATGNWIVFNGEIYNFRKLRTELEATGIRFISHSDTEVILAAYRTWGDQCFRRLRGMFAIALWDASRQCLLLARDHMGVKPLYFYKSEKYVLFASEVRTLLQTGLIPRKLDPNGIFSFLAFGSVYEPGTIIEGISAVPSGHVISLKGETQQAAQFWDLMHRPNGTSSVDGTNHEEDIRSLPGVLRDAVLSNLVSDVPVGVFLSGGIDSSSLVAVMSQAGMRASTFSLVFREEEFNEAEHSRLVARVFGTDHHEILVSQDYALRSLPQALAAMDQPTIDGINTWLVSEKTREAGVKVALTGLGADEMFAGYSNFRRVPQMERAAAGFARLPSALGSPMVAALKLLSGKNDRNRKLAELASSENRSVHPYFLMRTLFTSSEREALYEGDYQDAECNLAALLQDSVDEARHLDPVNRVSYLESHWYMRNTLLRDSDFMSMAHGLELRVPFLDPNLVETCMRIPGNRKVQGQSPKGLLLASLGVALPNEIVNRPKRGFTLPFEHWLRGELKPWVEETLSQSGDGANYLNGDTVREVWNRFLGGETSWSRPWSLFVLQRWCEQNL